MSKCERSSTILRSDCSMRHAVVWNINMRQQTLEKDNTERKMNMIQVDHGGPHCILDKPKP